MAAFELVRLFRKLKPRAVHLNSSMMGAVGSLAAKIAGVPRTIYCIGGWVFNEKLPKWKKNLYIWIERISAKWKNVIIVVHPGDEELAKQLNIKPKDKLVMIPNAIDLKNFTSNLLSREQAREILEIHPDAIIVGTVANAYPPKNLLWYLDVCKTVHEKDKRIHFVIIGDGPQFQSLERKRDNLKQQGYVMLAGRRRDATKLYNAFDIFMLPSSKEGMSITLLEAMAAKVPIIATDVGAARWMLGEGGVIIESGDLEQATNEIISLAHDDNKKQNISRIAHEMLSKRFDKQKTLEDTIKLID